MCSLSSPLLRTRPADAACTARLHCMSAAALPQMWGGSLAAAAAGVGLLLLVFGDRLPWARRQRKGGRWVADRALGGREVRVHTLGLEPRLSAARAPALLQRPSASSLQGLCCCSRFSIQTSEPALACPQVWIPDAEPSGSGTAQQPLQGTKAVPRFAPAGTLTSGGARNPSAIVPQWWDAPARLPEEQRFKAPVSAHCALLHAGM